MATNIPPASMFCWQVCKSPSVYVSRYIFISLKQPELNTIIILNTKGHMHVCEVVMDV